MKEEEQKQRHAEHIINLVRNLDYRRASIEARIYLGEITKNHSEFYKEEEKNDG